MDLYLMRHGEALSKQDAHVGTDAERPLSPDGVEAVNQVARGFKAMGLKPDRMLTSPLLRARQTAELVAQVLGCADRVEVCEALSPNQDPLALIEALRQFHADGTILAVGHQPYLGRLAARLVFGGSPEDLALPAAGVCVLELANFPRSLEASLRGLWTPEAFRPTRR